VAALVAVVGELRGEARGLRASLREALPSRPSEC
jgi:hypothetical protein